MKLLNSTPEEINEHLLEMATNSRALTDEVANICWYMRGSISWEEAWRLTISERQRISKLIKSRIETVEKTKLPIL